MFEIGKGMLMAHGVESSIFRISRYFLENVVVVFGDHPNQNLKSQISLFCILLKNALKSCTAFFNIMHVNWDNCDYKQLKKRCIKGVI